MIRGYIVYALIEPIMSALHEWADTFSSSVSQRLKPSLSAAEISSLCLLRLYYL